ncbi:MAG: pantetheine-phosphate adenylyltransferase [Clostridia bacterium]|nr:pantetheine-phosphate adenylyltransferase [Clostridia bacterium]
MKVCVFAGTFDPFTKGHKFVIEKCLKMFDKVIVAIGVNVDKTPTFTLEQRKIMIERSFKNDTRIEVKSFTGMLVDFMKKEGVEFYVRGIRDKEDYKYETTMERYNRDMYPEITTIYIPTPKELVHISSSAMRNILGLGGDIKSYVPEEVESYIKEIMKK